VTGQAENGRVVSLLHTDRAGVLAIRIWVEQTSPLQVRARITSTNDLDRHEHTTSTAGSTDEIQETVELWLSSFVSSIEMVD